MNSSFENFEQKTNLPPSNPCSPIGDSSKDAFLTPPYRTGSRRGAAWGSAIAALISVLSVGCAPNTQEPEHENESASFSEETDTGPTSEESADGDALELTDYSAGGPNLIDDNRDVEPFYAMGMGAATDSEHFRILGSKDIVSSDLHGFNLSEENDLVLTLTMRRLEREGDSLTMIGTAQYHLEEGDFTLHGADLVILTPNPTSPQVEADWEEGNHIEHDAVEQEPLATVSAQESIQEFTITFEGVPERGVLSYWLPTEHLESSASPYFITQQTRGVCYDTERPDWNGNPIIMGMPWQDCMLEGFN